MTGEVCVVGSFMMDIVVRTARRPAEGETVIGESLDFVLGGKGFNQAVAAARQGARTSMVGRLGADAFGDQFLAALDREGIDATNITRDVDAGTGVAVPVVDASGQNAIVIVPRANSSCGVDDIEAATPVIQGADVVLVQLELPMDTVRRALELARDSGTRAILNPAPMHASVGALAGLVDLVAPNESEATAIITSVGGAVPRPPDDEAVASSVAEALDSPAVLLTLGERGALLWEDRHVSRFAAHDVTVVDTVGAGDASCGVVAAALASDAPLDEAARRGTAAGSLAVTVPGAEPSMPTAAGVDQLLATSAPVRAGGRR